MIDAEQVRKVKFGVAFWLKRWHRSPIAYVIEHLGEIPTHQQAEVLKAFEHHDFVAVKSGHGIGKSKLMGWLVNWWLDTRGKRAPITGAGGDQLSDIVWPEVIASHRRKWKWISNQYESTTEELRLKQRGESWKAVLRVARMDNDDALQGFHDCFFCIDEGSGVRDKIFEVASGAMGDPGNKGFMTGNPTKTSGYMYDIFHKPGFWYVLSFSSENSMADEDYRFTYVDPMGEIRILSTRGRQTRQWIENMRTTYGLNSNVYRVRVKGEFATVGADMLIEERWTESVFSASIERGKDKKFKRRMGIDPAWTGDDDTGVVIREGADILHVESWHGFDLVESFERLKIIWDEWGVEAGHIDTVGVGAGLYDMFKHAPYRGQVGYPVVKVQCSEKAPEDKDGKCNTLRDWLWWKGRKFYRTRTVRYLGRDDGAFSRLRDELRAPTYKIQSGKIVAESKDELKKRGIASPNLADAHNLTFFQDYETFRESYTSADEVRRQAGKTKKKEPRSWKSR